MEAAIAGFPLKMSVAWLCPKPRTSKCLCFSKVTVIFLHSASVHTRCGANSHQNRNPLIRTNCKVYVKLTTPRNQFAKRNAIRRIGSHVKKRVLHEFGIELSWLKSHPRHSACNSHRNVRRLSQCPAPLQCEPGLTMQ